MLSKHDPHRQPSLASPCVRNCCLDDAEVCLGCGRTLAEIVRWHEASADEKAAILARAAQRRAARGAGSAFED